MFTKRQETYINQHLNQSNRVLAAALGLSLNNIRYFTQKNNVNKREIPEGGMLKADLSRLSDKEREKYHGCPKHGKDFLVKEGKAIYCHAETPGEIIGYCFYHVSRGRK